MIFVTVNSTLAAFDFHDETMDVMEKLKKEKVIQYFKPNDTEYEKTVAEINSHMLSPVESTSKPFEKIETITKSFMEKYNMKFTEFPIEGDKYDRFMSSMRFILLFSSQYNTYLTTVLSSNRINYDINDTEGIHNCIELAANVIFNPLSIIGMAVVHSLKPVFVNFPDIKPEEIPEITALFKGFIGEIIICISENFSEVTYKKITSMD